MSTQKFLAAVLIAAAVTVVPAPGAKAYLLNPYLGLGLGSASSNVKVDGAKAKLGGDFAYTFAAGFALTAVPIITPRVEFEYADLSSSRDGIDGKVAGYGVNGYVTLPIMPIVKPYIGVGFMRMTQEVDNFKTSPATVPQYMLGLDLEIPTIPVAGGIEWRYLNTKADAKDDYIGNIKSSVSTVLAKVRVQF